MSTNPFGIEFPKKLMPGAEPIFKEGGDTALLFLHGFTGSPYEGRELAEYFSQKGFTVWVPLLPGHGTEPSDLEGITYQEWIKAAEENYTLLTERYSRVVVCGQSMGGALALHLAATHPVDVLITLAAVVFLKDWRLHLLPLARKIIRYQFKSKGPDIRCKEAKSRSASYHKYPLKSLDEFLKLIHHVKSELPRIEAPALLIHSRRDHTITYENLSYIANHISSPIKKTLSLENSYHVISVDNDKHLIFNAMEEFINEIFEKRT
ncbi:MAG: alpha/beta fold hydrolase [Calditrichaeota bacterium]|nr:MAG: alpha/beta fold hydrolase [Calditrichota bacterium]